MEDKTGAAIAPWFVVYEREDSLLETFVTCISKSVLQVPSARLFVKLILSFVNYLAPRTPGGVLRLAVYIVCPCVTSFYSQTFLDTFNLINITL